MTNGCHVPKERKKPKAAKKGPKPPKSAAARKLVKGLQRRSA